MLQKIKRLLLVMFAIIPGCIFSLGNAEPLSQGDIDFFTDNHSNITAILQKLNMELDDTMTLFEQCFTSIDKDNGENFREFTELHYMLLDFPEDAETRELQEALISIGWNENGRKSIWKITLGIRYLFLKKDMEERFKIQNDTPALYAKYSALYERHGVTGYLISEQDLSLIQENYSKLAQAEGLDPGRIEYYYEAESPLTFDESGAQNITSYENEPRSILQYFCASWIRGDNLWRSVCIPGKYNPPYITVFDKLFHNIFITDCSIDKSVSIQGDGVIWASGFMHYIENDRQWTTHIEAKLILQDGEFKLDTLYWKKR